MNRYTPQSKTNAVADIAKHFNIDIDVAFNIAHQLLPSYNGVPSYFDMKARLELANIAMSSDERNVAVKEFVLSLKDHIYFHSRDVPGTVRDPEVVLQKYSPTLTSDQIYVLVEAGF